MPHVIVRPDLSARAALREGVRRVHAAPLLVAILALVTPLVTLPAARLAGAPPGGVHDGTGARPGWLAAQVASLEVMSAPSTAWAVPLVLVLGTGAGGAAPADRAATLAALSWLVVWALLAGGLLDSFVRRRSAPPAGFLAACRRHAWPFLRLAVPAGLVWLLLAALHARLVQPSGPAPPAWLAAALFAAPAAAAALLFDYARVRLVVEDRRSVAGALAAAVRLVSRRRAAVGGLFVLHALAIVLAVTAYETLSARAERADMHVGLTLGLGSTYIVARHYLTLLTYASATALVEGTVTGPPATDVLVWPEAPAAEPLTDTEVTSRR